MHEEEPRLLLKHMAVDGNHLDAVLPERGDHWVQLFSRNHEITGNCSFATASRLKADCCARTHGGWGWHPVLGDCIPARDRELIDAAIHLALGTNHLVQLVCIKV